MLRGRRLALLPVIAVLGALVAVAAALPPVGAAQTATARPGKLTVGVEVLHFNAEGRRAVATGLVTARLSDNGQSHTVRERVAVIAAAGRSCQVLTLYLKQLDLSLLGLNVHLSKVNLALTGDPHGGVLGSLFCKLARARVSSARASAARALNRRLGRRGQSFMHFTADVTAKDAAAAGATCQVLNLLLGPLKLTLLGLDVSLNQINLNITATQGGGVLGDLFCQLADNSTTTSTSTTTGTTTTTPTTTTTAP